MNNNVNSLNSLPSNENTATPRKLGTKRGPGGRYSREIRQENAEEREERQIYRCNTDADPGTHERFQIYFTHRHENQAVDDEEKGWKNPGTGYGE